MAENKSEWQKFNLGHILTWAQVLAQVDLATQVE